MRYLKWVHPRGGRPHCQAGRHPALQRERAQRHTAVTVALAAGVNPLAVSRLLNHASMRTTEQYLHLIPTALHEARDAQRLGLEAYTAGS